ncbi:MAG TPA: hypothetical protein VMF69_26170 [Gemmataceae bacterium]|nr:hypothetical protein [Gemmataceae bacterium]
MIASLADAWQWYESVKKLTLAMRQLGNKHWDSLAWEGDLGRDNRLRDLTSPEIAERSDAILADMDDLCVLLLFSVFEALVRERVLADITAEMPALRHPAIQRAIEGLKQDIEHGSFFRILDHYKALDVDLVEHVNQVRKFRNWVAHGRRGVPENTVDPPTAYKRLQRFLDKLNEIPLGTTGPLPT